MSEKHETRETKKHSSIKRRRVLRAISAGAVITGLGTGVGSAKSSFFDQSYQSRVAEDDIIVSKEGTDLKITDIQMLGGGQTLQTAEGGRAQSELKGIVSVPETSAIEHWFVRNGFHPNVLGAGGLTLTTNKEVVNEGDPVVVSIPYESTNRDDSLVQAGLVNYLIIDEEDGKRVPAAAIGIYTEETSQGILRKLIGSSEGDPVVFHEETIKDRATVPESGEISALAPSIGCATCQIVYDGLVGGTWGGVSNSACLYGCTASGPAYLACVGACAIIVNAIVLYGTFYTAPVFCSDVVNFC